ncbi:hypothetical protein CDAR_23531 [Caerostris darwini]|uniref:Uncharacterized protein n=1 Tax=Caerostris darwini TaxID=1538125 RepID=A0AAV4PIB4_9ARAC|nr:hypothetical protein CDAR_23531 [Caerostris darwini]
MHSIYCLFKCGAITKAIDFPFPKCNAPGPSITVDMREDKTCQPNSSPKTISHFRQETICLWALHNVGVRVVRTSCKRLTSRQDDVRSRQQWSGRAMG